MNTGANSAFDVHAFFGAGQAGQVGQVNATAFVSSLTNVIQTVMIRLADLHALPGGAVTVQAIELRPGSTDGQFIRGGTYTGFTAWSDPDALADLNTRNVASITNSDGSISLTLDPYEVAVIRYEAFDTIITNSTNYNDSVTGTDDRVSGTAGNDYLRLGAGRDLALGGLGEDAIYAGDGNDTVQGDAGNDYLVGGNGRDDIRGGIGSDRVFAGNDNDLVYGDDGNDSLSGEGGSDTIYGGLGTDTMIGGTGSDVFVFNTGSSIDTITDFSHVDDTIWLDDLIFTGLTPGAFAATAFVSNTSGLATSANQRVIYESDTGSLFYDRDGTGVIARVEFAKLVMGLSVNYEDFLVI